MWTSGRREADTTTWNWVTDAAGTIMVPIDYNGGLEGWDQPPVDPTMAACINFSYTAGGWDDDLCDKRMSYLCEEASETSAGCP